MAERHGRLPRDSPLARELVADVIGASNAVKVDIRVVAAPHQDIPTRRAHDRFHQDLYACFAGFEMVLPALRDRLEDLGTLIAAILPRVAPEPERITLDRYAARTTGRRGAARRVSRAARQKTITPRAFLPDSRSANAWGASSIL